MTTSRDSNTLFWTALGIRMGFTREATRREDILGAIDRMYWVQTPARLPRLHGSAVRAIVNAALHDRRHLLRQVGIAQLNGGRQLIGLEDDTGTRRYVLDLDSEAIYVLAELGHPLAVAQQVNVA